MMDNITLAVISAIMVILGFVAGFALSNLEREFLMQEMDILVDKALLKKFQRDEYVDKLEHEIINLMSVVKALENKNTPPPPPNSPLERCVQRIISDEIVKDHLPDAIPSEEESNVILQSNKD